jgi:sugar phosphate permease
MHETVIADNVAEPATAGAELAARWPILVAGLVGVTFGVAALFFYTNGVFITPLERAYGWSRTALSTGTLLTTMTMAATSPAVGLLIDRVSLRLVAVASMLGLSAGYYALSHLPNSIGAYFALMIGLSVVSAGTTPVVFSRLVNQWFDKARGLALGITMAGTGVAGAIAPGGRRATWPSRSPCCARCRSSRSSSGSDRKGA